MSTTTVQPEALADSAANRVAVRLGSSDSPVPLTKNDPAVGEWRRLDVIDRQTEVGAVITIERQRKSIGRLDRHDDGAGAPPGDPRHEFHVDFLALQECEHEVADLVGADSREQSRSKSQPAGADADIEGTAADVRVETLHPGDRHADLVGVQIDRAAAHAEDVDHWGITR